MTNALEKSRTELTVESADYNVGLQGDATSAAASWSVRLAATA